MFCLLFIITQTNEWFLTGRTKLLDSNLISKLWRKSFILGYWNILRKTVKSHTGNQKKPEIKLTIRTNEMLQTLFMTEIIFIVVKTKRTNLGQPIWRDTPWWGLFSWKLITDPVVHRKNFRKRKVKLLFSRNVLHTIFVENWKAFIYTHSRDKHIFNRNILKTRQTKKKKKQNKTNMAAHSKWRNAALVKFTFPDQIEFPNQDAK